MTTTTIGLLVFVALLAFAVGWLVAGSVAARRAAAEHAALREQLTAARTRLELERESRGEQQRALAQAEETLKDAFARLAADALHRNNQSFIETAQERFGELRRGAAGDLDARQVAVAQLVAPVKESLELLNGRLHELERVRAEAYGALVAQVGQMATSQQSLQQEAANLVKALRTPQVRGRWGEMTLKRVVEMAGMLEHVEFVEQESLRTESGVQRPDLLVQLPGDKTIVVDAKTSLSAYLDATEAQDDAQREELLRQHAQQVRTHIQQLSAKAYWDQFPNAPDFVVMFLPGESFFSAACQKDPGLVEYAVERQVIPASPTTLITLLRAIAFGWRQERIAENAQEISELGRTLYERIGTLGGHFAKVGERLDSAVRSFNDAVGSLETRVLPSARRFRDLGAATAGEIDVLEPVERSARLVQAPELGEGDREDDGN